ATRQVITTTMSEEEQVEEHSRSHSPTGSIPVKQRRPLRSCDTCRQRKSDGQNMPDGHCSSCLAFGSPWKRGRKHNLVDELKKENDDLKTENASLKAKLRSLSRYLNTSLQRSCGQDRLGVGGYP
ncbi:hypothetical protein B0H14DRAFT_2788682, partial [Mycena olivaceomarginata]